MKQNYQISVVGPVFMISSFFIPFMTISANSIGCRFQDARLMAVMSPTKVEISCVLHEIEYILILTGLSLYLLSVLIQWHEETSINHSIPAFLGMVCLTLPSLDLILLPIYPGLLGYLTNAVPEIGYILYMLGYVLTIADFSLKIT